jgi:peptidoglycan/xylan/chitin deacetylase (PgdA/CDA1 family)
VAVSDSFTSTTEWKLQSGTGTAYALDTVNTKDTASIKLSGTVASFMRNTTKAIDLLNNTGIRLNVFIPDHTKVNKLTVYVSNDTTLSKYATYVFQNYNFITGWNELVFGKNQLTVFNGFSTDVNIPTVQARIEPTTGNEAVVYFDILSTIKSSVGNVLFTMDDNWISQYTEAYRILKSYSIKGNIAVIPTKVGLENYMQMSQLQEVYSAGWDLLNHTNTHVYLGNLDKESQRAELLTTKAWMVQNGFVRGSDAVVYPYGSYNADTKAVLQEEGFVFGRTVVDGLETTPAISPFEIKVLNLTQDITVDTVKKKVDAAINTGSTLILLNHRFGATVDSMFYDVDKFEQVASYVAQKREEQKLNILTVTELMEHFN